MLYVGIDLGTYLCRFILAQDVVKNSKHISRKIKVLNYKTRVIDFGVMSPGQSISKVVIRRIENAFANFSREIGGYEDKEVYCVATAALRYSPQANKIIELIRNKFDIEIDVIAPKREIYLAALGCNGRIKKQAIVIDIGSGSTEISYVIKNKHNGGIKICDYISLEIGLSNNNGQENKELKISQLLNAFVQKHPNIEVIFSKCSVLKVAYNYFKNNARLNTVEGKKFLYADFLTVFNILSGMNDEQLLAMPLIGADRVQLIKKGLSWVHLIIHAMNLKEITLCECGLKEGIIYDMYKRRLDKLSVKGATMNKRKKINEKT